MKMPVVSRKIRQAPISNKLFEMPKEKAPKEALGAVTEWLQDGDVRLSC